MRTHLGSNHAPDVTTENGHNTINLEICTPDFLVSVIITILRLSALCVLWTHAHGRTKSVSK